jgi:ribosomal protein S18 acetylase RimI-like enzyme
MAVADPFRRRGVATSLLRAVDEQARQLEVPLVCLFVETKNRSAINLYMKVRQWIAGCWRLVHDDWEFG